MTLGALPIGGWLLLVATVAIPVTLVVTFYLAHYGERNEPVDRPHDLESD